MLFSGFPVRLALFHVENRTEGFEALLRGSQKAIDGLFSVT